ncbi:MAG: hypothetical protein LBH94_03880 [Deltaproteobacteria bacterium]|jgi:hypothetical protein|nr:hypothetical protein [Deltaproteobacteria bacterium]
MSDMGISGISAGVASGAMASALQQQALGAMLINKTLQGQGVVATPAKVVDSVPQHKGDSVDIRV